LTDVEAKLAFRPNAEFDALEHHCASTQVGPKPDKE
jgi:hypothetical protein